PFAQRPEPGDGEGGVTARMPPRLKMVANENGIETEFLGQNRKIEQFPWPELFCGGLVSQSERHGAHLLAFLRTTRRSPPCKNHRRFCLKTPLNPVGPLNPVDPCNEAVTNPAQN